MRQLLFVFALMGVFSLARAADSHALITNAFPVGEHGTLEMLAPKGWALTHTNLNLPGKPPSMELHSISNTICIRLTVYWDGFGGKILKPSSVDMVNIVSNTAVRLYAPISVEGKIVLEKLQGPAVTGSFARFTDAGWVPMLKDEYRNLTTGMFRCENLWGTFDLLTGDKDGPTFKQSLQVVESLRRAP